MTTMWSSASRKHCYATSQQYVHAAMSYCRRGIFLQSRLEPRRTLRMYALQQHRRNHDKTVPSPAASPMYVNESKRLLTLVSKQHPSAELERSAASVITAREAAHALLKVSAPTDKILLESIQKKKADIISLHHAFLAITSWCLEENILDCAMSLGQRANELSLALHLPLYQRLLDAVATHQDGYDVTDLLQVSSWLVNTLDVTDASPFTSSIKILIRQRRLPNVVEYLYGLQEAMKMFHLPLQDIAALILEVRELIRESRQDPSIELDELETDQVIFFLEELIVDTVRKRHQAKTGEISSDLNIKELRCLVEDIVAAALDIDDSYFLMFPPVESDDSDVSDSDEYDDDDRMDSSNESLDSILFLKISDKRVRSLMMDMVQRGRNDPDGPLSYPANLEPYQSGTSVRHTDQKGNNYREDESDEDESDEDESEQDESDVDENIEDGLLLSYARSEKHQKLPDVTDQVLRLNRMKHLHFSREYEEVIWSHDFVHNDTDDFDLDLHSDDDDDDDDYDDDDYDDDDSDGDN